VDCGNFFTFRNELRQSPYADVVWGHFLPAHPVDRPSRLHSGLNVAEACQSTTGNFRKIILNVMSITLEQIKSG
jgi:hypothetical protein